VKSFKKWIPAIVMMLVIFVSSSTKGTTIDQSSFNTEAHHIVGHFILFFLLCISYYKATKNIVYAILLSFVYALFDEFHQKYIIGRSASLFDIKVDIIGATVAGSALWKLQAFLPEKLRNWLKN
jgi:VanZ family protein